MASQVPPKRAVAFNLAFTLYKTDGTIIANPGTYTKKIWKDGGTIADIAGSVTETDTTYGQCVVQLSASEMTADYVQVYIKDDTSGCVPYTMVLYTAARLIDDLAYPATSGRSMVVDAAGLVDANAVKLGPTGSGTAQTARDIGASVLLSPGTGTGQLDITSGVTKANATQWNGLTTVALPLTPTVAGRALDVSAGGEAGVDWANVGSPTTTVGLSGTTVKAVTDGVTLAASAVQAIWDALSSALTTAGSIGKRIVDYLTGDSYARLGAPAGASVSADLAAIAAYVDTEVAAIKAVTDQLAAAQAEPTAVPAANATPLAKIAWLAALARNTITQTATTQTVKADDGTTPIASAAVSDDGTTFTRGEWS